MKRQMYVAWCVITCLATFIYMMIGICVLPSTDERIVSNMELVGPIVLVNFFALFTVMLTREATRESY